MTQKQNYTAPAPENRAGRSYNLDEKFPALVIHGLWLARQNDTGVVCQDPFPFTINRDKVDGFQSGCTRLYTFGNKTRKNLTCCHWTMINVTELAFEYIAGSNQNYAVSIAIIDYLRPEDSHRDFTLFPFTRDDHTIKNDQGPDFGESIFIFMPPYRTIDAPISPKSTFTPYVKCNADIQPQYEIYMGPAPAQATVATDETTLYYRSEDGTEALIVAPSPLVTMIAPKGCRVYIPTFLVGVRNYSITYTLGKISMPALQSPGFLWSMDPAEEAEDRGYPIIGTVSPAQTITFSFRRIESCNISIIFADSNHVYTSADIGTRLYMTGTHIFYAEYPDFHNNIYSIGCYHDTIVNFIKQFFSSAFDTYAYFYDGDDGYHQSSYGVVISNDQPCKQ
ncbi:unnamed protein product, partial [Mesorhabditis spiculigera]